MVWKRKSRMIERVSWTLCALLLVIVSGFLSAQTAWGKIGLGVDPGEINIKDVPLGKVVKVSDLGGEEMKLRIKNKGSSAYTYVIDILPTPKRTGALKEDYIDIPYTSWIWPEEKEVLIPGNSTEDVELFLKIPKKKEYYNKKYHAIIEVKSKKNRPAEIFVLACRLRMSFSTERSAKEKVELKAREQAQERERRREARKYYMQGRKDYSRRRYEQAIVQFQKALELNPDYISAGKYLERAEEKLRNLLKREEPEAEEKTPKAKEVKVRKVEKVKVKTQEEKGLEKFPCSITIVKTKDKWTEDPSFLSRLKKEFPRSSIEEIDYSTEKGKRLVEELNLDFLPAYLFSKDIEKNERFADLSTSGLIQQGNYYLWLSPGRSGVFIKRKTKPHTLEIFNMSQCPFTGKALKSIIGAKKAGKLPKDIKIDLHYIAPAATTPGIVAFQSLRGQPEVDKDIRQLCVKKYEPDKFLDYLWLRNKDVQSTDWQTPAKEIGIDVQAIEKCINEEGETLFKEDIKKAKELNIGASPTFIYENRILIVGFNLELLKELPGLEGLANE